MTYISLRYDNDALPIYIICNISYTDVAGVLSQEKEWQTATIAVFWSGKFTSTCQDSAPDFLF